MVEKPFEKYRRALLARSLTAIWRGHGSALFLEFGRLRPTFRRDSSAGNPRGEYTVMIEWSWRIENETSILCGSWSDEENWDDVLKLLMGRNVEDVWTFGRLPELSMKLSGGLYVSSFMTAEGQPAWTIFDAADRESRCISVENGKVREASRNSTD